MRSSGSDLARGDERVDQDLDVDLVVGAVDARRVVQRVGVDPAADEVELDAAQRRHAEVAAFADHLGAHLIAVDPHRIVGAVTDVGVGLGLGLDVGADAAVEQQIRGGLEDRLHQGGRCHFLDAVLDAQRGAGLRADRNGLLLPAVDAAALADQRAVVVLPAGPRQVEESLALVPRRRRVGVGVDEDVPVVERGEQSNVLGQQHPVAEHVAAHVTDADDGEVLGLGVHTHLPEVPLDRFPRALGGDTHRLVVVAHRSTRGERVAQPEAVGLGDLVGDVGERRGALVRGDHQIGVVAVAPDHVRRRHHGAGGLVDVVGDVEQSRDEQPVADHALGALRVAVGCRIAGRRRRVLDHESALRADRHDDGVLDRLRLDEAEDLGAEVLPAVRPAQSAAGHVPEPQVHALDPRRVHEDLELRSRQRKFVDQTGIELERQHILRARRLLPGDEVVGAQRGLDHRRERAQDAVGVQADQCVDVGGDGGGGGLGVAAPRRVVTSGRPDRTVPRTVRPAIARSWRCR